MAVEALLDAQTRSSSYIRPPEAVFMVRRETLRQLAPSEACRQRQNVSQPDSTAAALLFEVRMLRLALFPSRLSLALRPLRIRAHRAELLLWLFRRFAILRRRI